MDYFDIRKMPVSLWRNGGGETRELCCIPAGTRDFTWRASIATIASSGDFSAFPGVDRVITLLEGGEVMLDGGSAFRHTLKHLQPFYFAGEQPVNAQITEGMMSMDFNVMTRRDRCKASVRLADRSFTTWAPSGGIVFVLSVAWQLGDKLLTADQGAYWQPHAAVAEAGRATAVWRNKLACRTGAGGLRLIYCVVRPPARAA